MERPGAIGKICTTGMAREVNMATMFAPAHVRLTTSRQPRACGLDRYAQAAHEQLLQLKHILRITSGRALVGVLR
jgi:hypothetical protein